LFGFLGAIVTASTHDVQHLLEYIYR